MIKYTMQKKIIIECVCACKVLLGLEHLICLHLVRARTSKSKEDLSMLFDVRGDLRGTQHQSATLHLEAYRWILLSLIPE